MPESPRIQASVVYAGPDCAFVACVSLPEGATVGDAIEQSGIRTARPDLEVRADRLGVFARKARFATPLRDGDRVEVYRPLRIDPREARRRRAQKA